MMITLGRGVITHRLQQSREPCGAPPVRRSDQHSQETAADRFPSEGTGCDLPQRAEGQGQMEGSEEQDAETASMSYVCATYMCVGSTARQRESATRSARGPSEQRWPSCSRDFRIPPFDRRIAALCTDPTWRHHTLLLTCLLYSVVGFRD